MYIFNFHKVKPDKTAKWDHLISITPEGLGNVITTLHACGFVPVSIRDVLSSNNPLNTLPKHSCLITFDDGYEDFYQYAAPVLKKLKCPSINFIVANRFGGSNEWDMADEPPHVKPEKLMTAEQIIELGKDPLFTFGSHGLWHVKLAEATPEQVKEEIHTSYDILSSTLGESFVPAMAYPWGSYSPVVLEEMEKSKFTIGFTTYESEWTPEFGPYETPRYYIKHRDGIPPMLVAKLWPRHKILRFGMTKRPLGIASPIPVPGLMPNTQ
jgi:peptidoglycan/xylan/chitin deacetylase (PgdA/CDA1 family)